MAKAKRKLKSKEELLEIMNEHLETQQMFALKLKEKAESFIDIDEGEDNQSNKKKRNAWLNSYNAQVDAVSRTSSSMIKIFNSALDNGEEEDDSTDSLVD